MIHFDTNFLIDSLVSGSEQEAQMLGWLEKGEAIDISSVAWGEFLCGPLSPAAESLARQLFPDAEPLLRADGEKASELFNRTGRRSKSFTDCCIAAISMRCGSELATSNLKDFAPMLVHGLALA